MFETTTVEGEEKAKIVLYALSTCGWCAKTKRLLDEMGVRYAFVYLDLLTGEASKAALESMKRWNPQGSFPTLVINDKACIIGYQPEQIRGAIG